jgi:hypothetical protein
MSSNRIYAAMLDELEKLAEGNDPPLTTGQKAMAGAGLFMGSNMAAGMAQQTIAPRLVKNLKGSQAKMGIKDVVNLRRTLSPQTAVSNVQNPLGSVMIPKGGTLPKFMRPVEKEMYRSKGVSAHGISEGFRRGSANAPLSHSPEFLAHELGHASLRDPSKSGRLVRTMAKMRGIAPLGIAAGSAMAMSDDPTSMTAQLAPAAAAAGWAPALMDEGMASARGMKAIRGLGKYSPEAMKLMRGNLMKAFGTYGSVAAASTLPLAAITQWRAHRARQAQPQQA